jgi:multiple sugar transport system substrate-binding protein
MSSNAGWGQESVKEKPVTLRFVSWKPNQPKVWDQALQRFSKTYPHIKIVREIGPHSSTEYHDLLTQKLKNKDSSVDVFFIDVIWPSEFAAAGWALPLDNRFQSQQQEEFLNATVQAGTYQGHIYGIPGWIDTGMLYYRKDLLKKYNFDPPKTWGELVKQAATIIEAEKGGLRGYSGQFKQYEGLICNMLEFVGSNNGHLLSDDGAHSNLATPSVLNAVQFVRDKIVNGLATRAVLTYQEPESLAVFIQGKAVFHRNWPYAWEVANHSDRSKIAGKVGVTTLPKFQDGQSVAALGGWLYGISAYSRHPEEAWDFISFMASPEMQKFFAINASLAPARKALFSDPDILRANPQFRDQFAVFQTAIPRPQTPVYPAVSNIMQRFFSRTLSSSTVDIKADALSADRQINRLLNLAQGVR